MKNFWNKKESKKENPITDDKGKKTSKKNEKVEETPIRTEVQPIKGVFSKDDFKELAKMAMESTGVSEIILIGSEVVLDKSNHIGAMIKESITINNCDGFSTNYILCVKNECVINITAIISEGIDTALKELLEQNNHVLRIAK